MADHWHEFVYKAHCAGARARPRRACAGRFAPPPFAPPARAQQVVSSNTVGYNKITLKPGYNTISPQFLGIGASSITNILDVLDCTTLPTIDIDTATGFGFARLQTWDPNGGYTTYEWTGEGVAEAWEWEGIDNKWMTLACYDVATVSLAEGEGCWLWLDPDEVKNNIQIVASGEVMKTPSTTISLVPGYNLIANPYPIAIDIQDIEFKNLPTIDVDTATGFGFARLQTWDAEGGYTTYEWTGEGVAEAWEWDGIDNKWMTLACYEVAENVVIPVGASFWLWIDPTCENLSNDISVTFKVP